MNEKKQAFFSLIVGIFGSVLLFLELCYHLAYSSIPVISEIGRGIEKYFIYTISPLVVPLAFLIGGAFIVVLPISMLGCFFSFRNLKAGNEMKISIISFLINIINVIFAGFIIWLLFGLARGM